MQRTGANGAARHVGLDARRCEGGDAVTIGADGRERTAAVFILAIARVVGTG
jgi:hypothetical protein